MIYRVMVTAYGFADVKADSEENALNAVQLMDKDDFDWDYSFSPDDASVVDEFENDEESPADWISLEVANVWGDVYSNALKSGNIPYLFEIIDDRTLFCVPEEDYSKALDLIDAERKNLFRKGWL